MIGCMAHKLCHVFDGAIYTFVNYFRLDKVMQEFNMEKLMCVEISKLSGTLVEFNFCVELNSYQIIYSVYFQCFCIFCFYPIFILHPKVEEINYEI